MGQPLWKTIGRFPTKLTVRLPQDPEIALLGIHPRRCKTYVHTNTCTQGFIAALFLIAPH